MMTKFKLHLLSLLAVLSLTTLTSCETDDDIGYSLSGPNGKTWYGDFGATDYDGYPLFSELTFITGVNDDHGVGREELFYQDNLEYYGSNRFEWEIVNRTLYLYYPDYTLRIYDYYVGYDSFYGHLEDGFPFELYLDRRW